MGSGARCTDDYTIGMGYKPVPQALILFQLENPHPPWVTGLPLLALP